MTLLHSFTWTHMYKCSLFYQQYYICFECHRSWIVFAQVQRNYATPKVTIHRSRASTYAPDFSSHHVVRTSNQFISHSGKLCGKKCIVKRSETLIIWSAFCYTAGSDKSGHNRRGAMVIRTCSRHVKFVSMFITTVDCVNFDFRWNYHLHWSNYVLKLPSIFSVDMAFLTLCKEYLTRRHSK